MLLKSYLLANLCLLSSTALALDSDLLNSIDSINSSTPTNPQCEPVKIRLPFDIKGTKEEYNKCAIELCGHSKDNQTVVVTDINFSNYLPPKAIEKIKKIRPQIEKVVEKSKKERLSYLLSLKKYLTDVDIKNFDFQKIPGSLKSEIMIKAFMPYFDISYNPEERLIDRFQIKTEVPAWASKEYKKVVDDFAGLAFKEHVFTRYKNFYKENELLPLLNEKIESLLQKTEAGSNFEKALTELKISASKENLSSVQITAFFNELKKIERTHDKNFTNLALFSQCKSKECSDALKEYFLNVKFLEKIDHFISLHSDKAQTERDILRCQAVILASGIETSNMKDAKAKFTEVKEKIQSKLVTRFSAHSQKLINDLLAKIVIKQPKKSEDGNGDPNEVFVGQANKYLRAPSEFDRILPGTEQGDIVKKIVNLDSLIEDEYVSPCNIQAATAWDHVIVDGKDNIIKSASISISDYACSHSARGKEIIAHELGHIINYGFTNPAMSAESKSLYMKTRNCLAQNYPKYQAVDDLFSIDKLYTEEDMADLISDIVYTENKDKAMCALLMPDDRGWGYQNLAFTSDSDDPHSTAFTRVIMQTINRGQVLPESCKKLIEKEAPPIGFKKCNI